MNEMPLVFFTVFSQMAAGAYVTLYLIEKKRGVDVEAGRRIRLGIAAGMTFALLMSTVHLGHPEAGFRAMLHLQSSWLSREILLSGLFYVCTLLDCCPWVRLRTGRLVGTVGAISGALMVLVTSMVYLLPSHPGWNGIYPFVFFILTAVVSGPMFTLALSGGRYFQNGDRPLLSAVMLIDAVWFAAYAAIGPEVYISAVSVGVRVIVGAAVPLVLLLKYQGRDENYLPIIWGCVLFGEVFGRIFFYAGARMIPMFGM